MKSLTRLAAYAGVAATTKAVTHALSSARARRKAEEEREQRELIEEINRQTPRSRRLFGVTIRLRPNYVILSEEVLKKKWNRLKEESRKRAIHILEARLNHRGRSYSGLQVLMALVAAVEAAIVVFNVDKGLLAMHSIVMGWSAITAVVGLISLCIGVLPLKNEVMPEHTDDEGLDAIEKSHDNSFGYYLELRGRSTHQRRVLWRSRLWFAISVLITIFSLMMVVVGIAQFMSHM